MATAPAAPTINSVVAGNGTLTVTWTPNSDGGSPITGYNLLYKWGGGGWNYHASTTGVSPDTISGLTNGTLYTVLVEAINAIGTSNPGTESTGTPRTVPGTVTIGTATASGVDRVTVTWSAPSDGGSPITAYRLYSATIALPTTLTNTTPNGTDLTIDRSTLMTAGNLYYFRVKAVNAVGASASYSGVVSATPYGGPQAQADGPILTVGAGVGSGTIHMTWAAPTNNGGSAVTGYKIDCDGVVTTFGNVLSGDLTGKTNGTNYGVYSYAINAYGDGDYSHLHYAIPCTTPSAPQNVAGTHGNAQATVTFNAPSSTGGNAISSYRVYKCATSGGTYVDSGFSGAASGIVVTGLANGTAVYFKVAAINVAGEGTLSGASAGCTPHAPTVPNMSDSVILTEGNTQLVVTWSVATDDGGSAITGYDIYKDNLKVGSTYGAAVRTGTLTGLSNGVYYDVRVYAINAIGNNPSNAATGMPRTVPDATVIESVAPGSTNANVNWIIPGNNGDAIDSFNVYFGTTTTPTTLFGTTANGTIRRMLVTGLTNGTLYYFRVRATNEAGTGAYTVTPGSATPIVASGGNRSPTGGILFSTGLSV